MSNSKTYRKAFQSILYCSVFLLASLCTNAQQADSTKRTFFLNPKSESSKLKPHSERAIGNYSLPQSGVFEMPEETQYYIPPFRGQYYLDLAVEAYREEQKDKLGLNWLFKFLNAISPYVNNQFEFGVYQINDMPVVERDNPLFRSHNNDEERH